jgi:redox-sensitive bicupin YhaK (pirin superfamily)
MKVRQFCQYLVADANRAIKGGNMITLRPANQRGLTKINWLTSYHTFSFGHYYDADWMGFGSLRVINEDTVLAGAGFGTHPHDNMEIISYVISGELAHKDSMGTGSIIKPGEIQRMSAGSGVTHSEFNYSADNNLHFLQIWIIPDTQNLTPSYEQKEIKRVENQLILIGAPENQGGLITIHQNVNVFAAYLTPNTTLNYTFKPNRLGWIQVIKGSIKINNISLQAGDGASITAEQTINIQSIDATELLLFDLI